MSIVSESLRRALASMLRRGETPGTAVNVNRFDDIVREQPWPIQSANEGVADDVFALPRDATETQRADMRAARTDLQAVPQTPDAGGGLAGQTPDVGNAGGRFQLEGGDATGVRRYAIPANDGRTVDLKVLPNGEVAWVVRGGGGNLSEAQRASVGLRAVRGIQEALTHDAATFGTNRFRFQGDARRAPIYRMLGQNAEANGFDFAETGSGVFELRRRAPNAPARGSEGPSLREVLQNRASKPPGSEATALLVAAPAAGLTLRELLRDRYAT